MSIKIGISMYPVNEANEYYLPSAYVKSVRAAGGTPILLPAGESDLEGVMQVLDGLLLPGGGDIMPEIYGGSNHSAIYGVSAERDSWEISLAQAAIARQMPLLGICRGLQVINVAFGGNLYLHLPDHFGELCHRLEEPTGCTQHQVEITRPSKLAQALGVAQTLVTSWHHQAIDLAAPAWQVVAVAEDGVIEAIEHSSHPWAVAVQWHPELSPDCAAQASLFKSFIQAATEAKSGGL
ncbi:MAG: gamma-glutamyl-gamma-aminobutyrate hydrolase family protein [Pseudanabaenaceae cyanobacterium bins.68]|nr:gamma-glutamyl-gamma-aminobutyrate hydrolase family protein [Pseudanabaenaceae cyanobacterium bins.68]